MFDVNDDAKAEFRRVEILTGPVRRRSWSAEEKARIVEEALAPGARVSEVARRWQVCPQQVLRGGMRHIVMSRRCRARRRASRPRALWRQCAQHATSVIATLPRRPRSVMR